MGLQIENLAVYSSAENVFRQIKSEKNRHAGCFFSKEKVYKDLGISLDKKIVLYLPTFRDDHRTSNFNLDILSVLETVNKKFNEDYIAAIRLHPSTKKQVGKLFDFGNENIVDAISYPDIQELLVASDIIITDYSSGILDAMLEYKKCFIFATDLELYQKERGFYFPLSDTPFSVAENNEELIENIKIFDENEYLNKVETYLKEKYNDRSPLEYYERGLAYTILHKDSRELLETLLHMLAEKGEDATFEYIKNGVLKKR